VDEHITSKVNKALALMMKKLDAFSTAQIVHQNCP